MTLRIFLKLKTNNQGMRKPLSLLVVVLVSFFTARSQDLREAWGVTAGGSGEDSGTVVATDHHGGVYVGGKFNSPTFSIGSAVLVNSGGYDGFLAKFDAAGNFIWAKAYGGAGNQEISALAVSPTDKLYAAGTGFNLAKMDGNGNILWQLTTPTAYASEIALDSKESIYIGGRGTFSKYSTDGSFRYTKTFPTSVNGGGSFFYLSVDRLDNIHVGIFGASTFWNVGPPTNQNILIEYSSRLWFDSAGIFQGHQQLSSNFNNDITSYTARYPNEYFYSMVNTPLTSRFSEFIGGNISGVKGANGCYKTPKRTNNAVDDLNNEFYCGELTYGSLVPSYGCVLNFALSFLGEDTIHLTTGKDIFFVKKSGMDIKGLASTEFAGKTDEGPARLAIDTVGRALYVVGYWAKSADTAKFRFGGKTLTNAGSVNTNDLLLLKLGYADQPLTLAAGFDRTVCKGGSTQLSAAVSGGTGNFTYLWSPATGLSNPLIPNPVASPASSTAYVLTVTDGAGTTVRDTVNVNINPDLYKPTIAVAVGTNPFCEGQQMVLIASAATNYVWSKKAASTTTFGNSATVSTADTLTVTTINSGGCTGTSDPFYAVMKPRPAAPVITPAGNAQGNAIACNGNSVTLTAQSTQSPVTYLWNNGATTPSITAQTNGIFYAAVTGANGCTSLNAFKGVVFYSLPAGSIAAAGSTNLCSGDSVQLRVTTADTTSVLWNTGATAKTIWVKTAGTYGAQLNTAQGCSAPAANPVTVQVYPRPAPSITQSGNTLTALPAGASYQWYSNNTAIAGATSQTLLITTGGAYSVKVINANGCSAMASFGAVLRTVNPSLTYQVYPNPATNRIGIVYTLPQGEQMSVTVKSLQGQNLLTVVDNRQQAAGDYQYNISAAGLPKGLVYVVFTAGNKIISQKVLIL